MTALTPRTHTFLFTDIEGSTRRWESARAAMSAALARHDAILRTAIESAGGKVFKTMGDAFCAVFADPVAALRAALEAQRALRAEDWAVFGAVADGASGADEATEDTADFGILRVRMALHSGLVEERDGDFFGPPLNRVARLLSAGHGGQVLLSAVTEGLLGGHLPADVSLRDLGEHRLKDLARAERVWQLAAVGLAGEHPPLRSLERVRHNLPVQLDNFIGREAEIEQLRQILAVAGGPRLVTLTGIGGTGKTRLALQAVAELVDDLADGVWFVDLAPLAAGSSPTLAVVAALGLRDEPTREPLDSVADQLAGKRLLLVLDNCEHMVAAVAALASRLLQSCPGLRLLATSREPLAVTGERRLPIEPLSLPTAGTTDLSVIATADAVRLFLDRAAAARPDFALARGNAPAVAEICRRLDGIPLAIELAAARVRAMAPEEIARRLDLRFRLLAGGARDRLPRQQTLRAAIDWSYDLLPESERRVLERFAVFAAAVPLAAVEAVCTDGREEEDWIVFDALTTLVDKSLVVTRDVQGLIGYRLLETVRAYAAEKLVASGGESEARERQLDWYRTLAVEAGIERLGADCEAWTERLMPMRPDLEEAIRRSLEEPALVEPALATLDRFWWLFFYYDRRATWGLVTQAIVRMEDEGWQARYPLALYLGSLLERDLGEEDRASALRASVVRIAVERGDRRLESWAIQDTGIGHLNLGDLDQAAGLLQEAVAIKRELGDSADLSITLSYLGDVERTRGDMNAAATYYREALDQLPPAESSTLLAAYYHHNLGQVLLCQGDLSAAGVAFRQALAQAAGEDRLIVYILCGLAGFAAAKGMGIVAGRLVGAAQGQMAASGDALDPNEEIARAGHEAAARALLTAAEWEAAFAAGKAMGLEEAVAYASAPALGGSDA